MRTGDHGHQAVRSASSRPSTGSWVAPEPYADPGCASLPQHATKAVELLGRIDLPGEAASVRKARHYLRVLLAGTGHPQADYAVLLVSELVANAVRHSDSRLPRGQVTVTVARRSGTLHVDVIDAGSATSSPRVQVGTDTEMCTGRGLWLVQELAVAWGWHESKAGRVVWFQLALSNPSTPS